MKIRSLARFTTITATIALAAALGFAQPAAAGHRHGGHHASSHHGAQHYRHRGRHYRRHHYRRHHRGHYYNGGHYYEPNPVVPLVQFFGALAHHGARH